MSRRSALRSLPGSVAGPRPGDPNPGPNEPDEPPPDNPSGHASPHLRLVRGPAHTLSASTSDASTSARRAGVYANLLAAVDPTRGSAVAARAQLAADIALMAADAEHHKDVDAVRSYTAEARRAADSLRAACVEAGIDFE